MEILLKHNVETIGMQIKKCKPILKDCNLITEFSSKGLRFQFLASSGTILINYSNVYILQRILIDSICYL